MKAISTKAWVAIDGLHLRGRHETADVSVQLLTAEDEVTKVKAVTDYPTEYLKISIRVSKKYETFL